jgi:hypothetical protein
MSEPQPKLEEEQGEIYPFDKARLDEALRRQELRFLDGNPPPVEELIRLKRDYAERHGANALYELERKVVLDCAQESVRRLDEESRGVKNPMEVGRPKPKSRPQPTLFREDKEKPGRRFVYAPQRGLARR